jgi:hypothetical protein
VSAPIVPLPLPGRSGVDSDDVLADVIDLAQYPGRQAEAVALGLAAVAAELRELRAAMERCPRRRWWSR